MAREENRWAGKHLQQRGRAGASKVRQAAAGRCKKAGQDLKRQSPTLCGAQGVIRVVHEFSVSPVGANHAPSEQVCGEWLSSHHTPRGRQQRQQQHHDKAEHGRWAASEAGQRQQLHAYNTLQAQRKSGTAAGASSSRIKRQCKEGPPAKGVFRGAWRYLQLLISTAKGGLAGPIATYESVWWWG